MKHESEVEVPNEVPKIHPSILPLFEVLKKAAFDGFWSKDAYTLMSGASTEVPIAIQHISDECKVYKYVDWLIIISEGATPDVQHSDHVYVIKDNIYMHYEGKALVEILWPETNI